ncbi:glycosyltransferase [Acinetobacter indicus]|uniref:glycosyltransferase n=1 Tax=Acinetobacter indicus TaxID=756892 RepID=UPI000CEBF385|nr:glycosyltransferase [Acinetobacter indicus]
MKVLHISGNFIGNKLYQELFKKLSLFNINQFVYVPVRNEKHIGLNKFDFPNIDIKYDLVLKPYHRFFYFSKIKKITRCLVDYDFDLIHAHTLFSDGGVAYQLYRKKGINYIVNIRNTDINIFYKYFPHLKLFAQEILLNSKYIVFLSNSYLKKFIKIIPMEIYLKIKDRILVIPNGIHDDFFSKAPCEHKSKNNIDIVSIGKLDKNKNMITLLKLIKNLNKNSHNFKLHVIGDGPEKSNLISFSKNNGISNSVSFYGQLDRNSIIDVLDSSDVFMLLSKNETFGISYIEALSRGLPLIYTKNEGVDGYFDEGLIGYSVDPLNLSEIENALMKVVERLGDLSSMSYRESKKFNWDDISKTYFTIYQSSC